MYRQREARYQLKRCLTFKNLLQGDVYEKTKSYYQTVNTHGRKFCRWRRMFDNLKCLIVGLDCKSLRTGSGGGGGGAL